VWPFSKTGGLGDVAGSLPIAIKNLKQDIFVVTPLYGTIDIEKWGIELLKSDVKVEVNSGKILKFDFYQTKFRKVPIYFVDCSEHFSKIKAIYVDDKEYRSNNTRYLVFNIGVLKLLEELNKTPDIIHCNDWHTGLIPNLLKKKYNGLHWTEELKKTKTLFTIHNLLYQSGTYYKDFTENDTGMNSLPEMRDRQGIRNINFAKRAIIYSDTINAVSPRYAQEILTPKFGHDLHIITSNRKDKIFGIMNGIDYKDYNPATDLGIYAKYSVDTIEKKQKNKLYLQKKLGLPQKARTPVLAMISRIAEQKGFNLLLEILPSLLKRNIQLIIMGTGDPVYEDKLKKIARKFSTKMVAKMEFDQDFETQILAGSDIFLMPSRFEPAGISQLKSLRYGCIPVVNYVGGLADSISDISVISNRGNGFVFRPYNEFEFYGGIVRALNYYKEETKWKRIVKRAMGQVFSWDVPAKKYVQLYRKTLKDS
jgi:starch synthase